MQFTQFTIFLLVTGFQKGGLERELCKGDRSVCFSLHALWDAEMLKFTGLALRHPISPTPFNLKKSLMSLNRHVCELYVIGKNDDLEKYSAKFAPLMKSLMETAVEKILWLLQQTLEMDNFNTALDFEREISRIFA